MSNILKYQNPSSPLLIQQVNQSNANFVKRLLDPNRKSIPDWETKGQKIATHKMSWGEDDHGAYVFPEIQEIDDQLIDFSRPPYASGIADYMAHKNNNIIRMSPEEADWFTRNYKQYYPSFKKGGRIHIKKKNRGKFTAAAKRAGMGVQEFAQHVLANKDKYSSTLVKRANFARNSKKFKHENGGILKAQEGINELYPAGIAVPSNETIDFFKDFAQRYKKLNHINRDQLIQGLVAKDKAIVSNRGLPKYNTDTKQIFIPSDDMEVSTYPHELAHKLNDLVLERTDKERKLLNDAYPLSIAKYVYGRAPEDMRNELIEDEKFSTNTELRRKISSDYGNVLGKKLNKVIKSLSTNDIVNYVNNINGYVGESDFLKYPEHIFDGKTLFEHWKEDYAVPEYDNVPWEELPKCEQDQWQYLYDSREGVAPNYMIFDEDKPKAIKKALIKVAQESKSNDIRSKNFINVSRQGGVLKAQNSAKLPGGYAQYDGSDLSDVETFNKNWLNYRNSQLANQGWKDESIKNKLNWFQRNFGASDKTVANLVREQLFSNLDNTKELSFSDALKDSQGRRLLTESMYSDFPGERKRHEVEVGPPKPVEDWKLDYSFNGSVAGTHYPDFNTIIYNNLYQNTPTKIHERDHAMFGQYNDKNIGLKIVDNIFKQEFLDDVVDKWGYYDEPGEIRARLMQMRYNNQLDPKHKYTFDEIENMRNDPTFIDEHIFDRYTNRYIEYLLNDVAQNTTNKNRLDYRSPINFAKVGGILKAQEGTWNLLTPQPLSPLDIAMKQAKAMAKMKEEQPQQPQQHLPPGVKEVVGPDGKKVAIRTEQLLVPLEQSIAEWLPGTGDVAEVGYIANDVKNGNYGSAALAAAMVALPGNVGKIFRKSDIPASKLTEAERLGIPKGERNQPAKAPTKNQTYKKTANLESDKDYLEDIEAIQQGFLGKTFLDSEHEALLDWFNSPQYKERLVKQGFSEEQINNLLSNIKDKLSRKNLKYAVDLNSIRQWGIGPRMALEIDPQLHPAYEAMTNGNIKIGGHPINWSLIQLKKGVDLDEMVPHEVGGHHLESLVAEFNEPYTSQQITDIGKKATISSGLPEGYYPSWWETRARALTIAKQMREAGWNPNSPEQVNVWLNKHLLKDRNTNVVQGALYYDRSGFVKAVSEGLKNGGKL